jgi:hypothetical protein
LTYPSIINTFTKNNVMHKIYSAIILSAFFFLNTEAQNVGIGTTNPETKLQVNGAISFNITVVNAAASIVIPENTSIVSITNDGVSAANTITATAPKEGQMLTIYNNDAQAATFNGYTILPGSGVISCVYVGGGWRLVSDNSANGNSYVKNQTTQQAATNFNISGSGTAGSLISPSLTSNSGNLNVSGGGWGMNFYIDTDNNSPDNYTWNGNGNEIMRLTDAGTLTINNLATGYVKSTAGVLSSSTTVPWGDVSGAPAFLTSYTETDPQVGANTTNYVPRWDGSALVSGIIQDNGTRVGIGKAPDATYSVDIAASLRVSQNNATGGGIKLADDGDIVDMNDGYATHRFSYGLKLTNANSAGSTVVQIANGVAGSGNTYFNTGNLFGINTDAPIQTLDVNGRLNVRNGVIQRGGTAITATADLGLYSRVSGNWMRYVTNGARHAFFTTEGADGVGSGSPQFAIEANGNLHWNYNGTDGTMLPESFCVIVPRNRTCPAGWGTYEVKWDTADASNADQGKNGIIAWDDGNLSSVRMRFCCRGAGW